MTEPRRSVTCPHCGFPSHTPESVSLTREEAQEIIADLSFWGREFEEAIMLKLRHIAESPDVR